VQRPSDARARPRIGERDAHVWRDSLVVGLLAAVLYIALRQPCLYGPDGVWILAHARVGNLRHPHHFAYLPLLAAAKAALAPFGIGMPVIAASLSAVTMAAAVALAHRATAVLGEPRARAALVAAGVAFAPAVLFFATTVELHGPFMAFAGLAYLATAHSVRRPTLGGAACVGLATGAACAAHATGQLLPLSLWTFMVALARPGLRRALALGATLAAVHVAVASLIPLVAQALAFPVSSAKQWSHLTHFLAEYLPRPWLLLNTAWRDWLWPFAPLSFVALLALVPRGSRAASLALHAGLVPYLAVTMVLMGEGTERGAYMLPLAWPLAVVAMRFVPPLGGAALAAASLVLALVQVAAHDHSAANRAFARGFLAVNGDGPAYLITGDLEEVEACYLELPEVLVHVPIDEVDLDPALLRPALPVLSAYLRDLADRGYAVYLTAGGERWLRKPERADRGESGPLILDHILASLAWEEVAAGSFKARRLR
jgi:hypothetical protein